MILTVCCLKDFNLCVILGLCSSKDSNLVRGTAKEQEKVHFLRGLIELVELNASQAANQAGAAQRLLCDVVSDSRAILSKQVTLFPADMDPIYSIKGSSVPSDDIGGAISTTKEKLKEIEEILASSYDVSNLKLADEAARSDIAALKKEVQEQFDRLQFVMKQFEAVYALDIKPWCREDESGAELVGLGPSATNLLSLQKNLQVALSNLKLFKSNYQQMATSDSSDVTYCDLGINEQSIIAVQEQCSILEKAILRRQEVGVI